MAHFDAFIADIGAEGTTRRARYELSDVSLTLVAKRTPEVIEVLRGIASIGLVLGA
jgi:hypothetical protein